MYIQYFSQLLHKYRFFIAGMLIAALFSVGTGRAHAAIILTDTNNVLPNTAMSDNLVFDSTQPFGVRKIGDKGYLVVGSGAFDNGMFAITYESPTNTPFNITIEHASICNGGNPYGYVQGIDFPDNGTNPTTYFWTLPASFTTINQRNEVAVGRDCTTTNRTITVGTAQMTKLPDGDYGGIIIAALSSSGAGSQQNSFRLLAPAGVVLGYSSATVNLASDSMLNKIPASEKSLMDIFFPEWRSLNTAYKTSINLANTALPQYGFTNMQLNFVLDYCTPEIPAAGIKIRFYDADDSTNGGTLQGTALRPELHFGLYRRPRNNPTAWPDLLVDYRLIGGNHQFEYVNLPALNDQYYYTGSVIGLSQPNALQFSLDVGTYGMDNRPKVGCENPPIPDCSALTVPAAVKVGSTFTVTATLKNNYYRAVAGAATSTTGYHLGVTNAAGLNPPDIPNPNANAPNGQWYPLNSSTNLANEYQVASGGYIYTRMPISAGIAANGSTTYTFTATAPNTAVDNKYFGVRVLDRDNSQWDAQQAVCDTTINVVDSFALSALPQPPVLNDDEAPTSMNVTSLIGFSGGVAKVNGVNTTSIFFLNSGGVYDATAGTVTGGINKQLSPSAATSIVNVATKPTDNILGTTSVAVPAAVLAALKSGDNLCVTLTITPTTGLASSTGTIQPGATGTSTRTQCTTIINRPYMKVFGGDVMAGSGFGNSCTTSNSDVTGFARQLSNPAADAGKWVGAGTQLGVFANGSINQFATSTFLSELKPSTTAFSNTSATGSVFGGGYGAKFCNDDFWATKLTSLSAGNGAVPALNSLTKGQYQYNSGASIDSAPIDIKERIAIYVDGDVTITTNIKLSTTPVINVESLPSFYLVARGNIYIAPGVTQLDGVYVAMPRVPAVNLGTPADGGRIFTCTDNASTPSNAALLGACLTNRLTINGMFAATRVNFLRSAGSVRDAKSLEHPGSTNIAETFNFIPEIFLAVPAPSVITTGQYDSVISLPPAL